MAPLVFPFRGLASIPETCHNTMYWVEWSKARVRCAKRFALQPARSAYTLTSTCVSGCCPAQNGITTNGGERIVHNSSYNSFDIAKLTDDAPYVW